MKYLLAPDSFKEAASAQAVAESMRRGVAAGDPGAECRMMPLSDGGEGLTDALVQATSGELRSEHAHDALGRPIITRYGFLGEGGFGTSHDGENPRTAVVELAAASGIERISPADRDPLAASTFGTGELIRAAIDAGAERIVLGLGGSATTDGGTGLARALGHRFLDADDCELPLGGGALPRLARIDDTEVPDDVRNIPIVLACDVTNPLTGTDGAAAVFAPQKGADAQQVATLDAGLARLADAILPPDERAFNQTVVYGKDTDAGAVINLCRQMPMTGTRQVVIVREAQSLRRLEQLSLYTASPCATTILVLCHKERNMDKRSQLYKQIAGRGVVFESVRPRDYEIAGWLAEYIRSRNCTIDAKSVSMLVDHLGADIAKIANEIDKLMTFLPEGTSRITAEHIEQNIGISKDFNNFELTRALSEKDMARALRIADHFARNPKENPLLVTLGTLFTHFQRIFIVNYQRWLCRRKGTPMPPDAELARMLKLSSAFFLKEYQQAASLYPNSRVFAIMGLIREYDLKSKGIDSGQATDGELLKELLLKIFVLR